MSPVDSLLPQVSRQSSANCLPVETTLTDALLVWTVSWYSKCVGLRGVHWVHCQIQANSGSFWLVVGVHIRNAAANLSSDHSSVVFKQCQGWAGQWSHLEISVWKWCLDEFRDGEATSLTKCQTPCTVSSTAVYCFHRIFGCTSAFTVKYF